MTKARASLAVTDGTITRQTVRVIRIGPFTEGVPMAAQKICRTMGVGRFPQAWS
jgi:hypothetical protein